jgi:hypothetical protein
VTFDPGSPSVEERTLAEEVTAMPDGVLQWIDPASGQAAIVRAGHVYTTSSSEIEPVARHPGARVHFDIRHLDGGERAVEVRLRPGTRVSHHQRRYGTLAGARRPDTKGAAPFAHAHPERGREFASHPLEVARAWVDGVQARDLDGLLALYSSDAVVHVGDDDHVGRSHIATYPETSPVFGTALDPEIRGDGGTVVVHWPARAGVGVEVRARVEHGLIAEQWVGVPAADERAAEIEAGAGGVTVAVVVRGRVDDDDVDYAISRVEAVLRHLDDPVLFARLKLDRAADPARAKPALAQVALDVNGELLRAHVAAHTMREAADLLQRRLSDKLDQRAQRRDDLRSRGIASRPGEWRHGDLPAHRPEYYDRPPEERQLVRHKTFAIDELTVDEAAFDMEQLDYDFHLFRDLATGEDAVLERHGKDAYRLTRLHPTPVESVATAIDVTVADSTPSVLTVQEAIERLDAGGEPFVFFANAVSGRGNVVYRRYDGHDGLITAAEEC